MQMRPDVQIQSVLKAMTDVIVPALDPQNQLAQEQAKLCMGLLTLLRQQLPLQFRFDCDELARWSRLAEQVLAMAARPEGGTLAVAELLASQAQAADVLQRARAEPAEVVSAVRGLRSAAGALLQTEALQASPLRPDIEKAVLQSTREQLLRDRASVRLQGWEQRPDDVPAIESLLGLG